jgi:hypothetical protein
MIKYTSGLVLQVIAHTSTNKFKERKAYATYLFLIIPTYQQHHNSDKTKLSVGDEFMSLQ